ncbi:MAG: hypothetical protein JGK12_25450 [Microcoleus sp. PH2017_01_SCD_O_A]|uniref:hypothetical protein n=1 Tax=unclassified Microcoleus TaxID=2642155 RepID=UPI001D60311E|nr:MULTISPECIES: hypothetical protein [unclassified Microcoleus]TAF68297.1 MAG: hypothetical protein EAZ59_11535 [Oscillatoriales cyanobacterium]MCC3427165.1 hypothetical protein [Microcoleus sp. PH2017_01_SCD_O_A]MCC3513965.1 hypothetical protein [Microcoleus sp. PH2017_18_LLB_O_A]MCC3565399.1 hypothetical protein [Microcoleus sp. PH2017_31_RDM_U_A]MCC3574784.1 hypothetical protein [Microcoleus sp. PH2017_34_RAT_O_A]
MGIKILFLSYFFLLCGESEECQPISAEAEAEVALTRNVKKTFFNNQSVKNGNKNNSPIALNEKMNRNIVLIVVEVLVMGGWLFAVAAPLLFP